MPIPEKETGRCSENCEGETEQWRRRLSCGNHDSIAAGNRHDLNRGDPIDTVHEVEQIDEPDQRKQGQGAIEPQRQSAVEDELG